MLRLLDAVMFSLEVFPSNGGWRFFAGNKVDHGICFRQNQRIQFSPETS